ncbi:hypothetical protein ACFXOL_24905 [Streptomyces californicus]|uniref:hypothetical protein n=1 Tax=Streptomyces TaxID=1883 RepID=UPI001F3FB12D|nr:MULTISPECIES: hypothetical protein [Streptomyces]
MIDSSVINDDSPVPVSSETVLKAFRSRIDSGRLETWLTSSTGRSLAFVTNAERAMVMLLEEESDPGEHAVAPRAQGRATGFVPSNGQDDEYPDEDTVPISEAFQAREAHRGHGILADGRALGGRSPSGLSPRPDKDGG